MKTTFIGLDHRVGHFQPRRISAGHAVEPHATSTTPGTGLF
jgi:hypothetical protein